MKGTRDKEYNEKAKKQTWHPLCSDRLNKGTEGVKEKKPKKTKEKTETAWYSPAVPPPTA